MEDTHEVIHGTQQQEWLPTPKEDRHDTLLENHYKSVEWTGSLGSGEAPLGRTEPTTSLEFLDNLTLPVEPVQTAVKPHLKVLEEAKRQLSGTDHEQEGRKDEERDEKFCLV